MTKNIVYSDFLSNFDAHPVTGDLIRVINEASVKRAVRNIIFTNKGERFFNPTLGCGIRRFLFEPMTPATTVMIENAITESLYNFEPRINQLNVNVTPDYNNDAYNISISFYILNINDPVSINLSIDRIR
jgi:phage baseplate assembly protein W